MHSRRTQFFALVIIAAFVALLGSLPAGAQDDDTALTEDEGACERADHPVATRIAEGFDVPYATIIAMHCEGAGFGGIVRAFLLAEAAQDDNGGSLVSAAQEFLNRHAAGEGWGQLIRDSGLHPRDLAPGRVFGRGHNAADAHEEGDGERGHGNGRGNGNANGNSNGRGNGNGNDDD
jgi:hypothetical protein